MRAFRKSRLFYAITLLAVILLFISFYNTSIKSSIRQISTNDKDELQSYNNEIVVRLTEQKSTENWAEIVEEYENLSIKLEDSGNNVIVRHISDHSTSLDAKKRTAFEFKGKAYLLTSSIYIFRDFSRSAMKYILVELIIVVVAFAIVILLIYAMMLRPFQKFYMLIEEYEKTGDLSNEKFRGYVGKVYERFILLTKNLEDQQNKQRRIIASISHDIKTPLTSLMGYTERLQKGNISPERREKYLGTVYNKSLEIRGLVDEFDEYLDYNMLQKAKTIVVSVQDLKNDIISEYADELESMGVDLRVFCEEKKSYLRVDLTKMKRVFGNLIGNSLKHFNKDEKIIQISFVSNKNKIVITFEDNGEGIDSEDYELIFEPLYTSDKGRKVAGLGLAICREIIESHDGKIYAKNSTLGGLQICIELNKVKMPFLE